MSIDKFISTLLPADAWFSVVIPEGVYWRHIWINPEVRAAQGVAALLPVEVFTAGKAYFSCAGYHNSGTEWAGRTQDNTSAVRSFWLDIDAGATKRAKHGDKVYEKQGDAISAVGSFCKTHFVAPTYMVDSGEGVHVYWAFNEAIPVKLWAETLAPRFAQLCSSAGLKVDGTRTRDAASILRLPGSRASNKQVSVIYEGHAYPVKSLAEKLPKSLIVKARQFQPLAPDSARTPYKAAWAIYKAQEGSGCAQIRDMLNAQGNVQEPLWRAGLALVAHGSDTDQEKRELFTRMSSGHPDFSIQKTLQKAAETLGPYTCDSWAALNPSGCSKCRFNGLAKNPCRFGQEENESKWELAGSEHGPLATAIKGLSRAPLQIEATEEPLEESLEEPLEEAARNYQSWLDARLNLSAFKLKNGTVTKYVVGGGANDPAKYIVGQWRANADAEDWNDLYPAELAASAEAQKYGITRVFRTGEGAVSTLVVCDGTVIPRSIVVTAPTSAAATDTSGQLIVDYFSAIGQGSLSVATAKYSAGCRGDSLAVVMGNVGVTLDTAGLKGFLMYLQTAASTMVNRRGNIDQAISMGWTGKNSFVLGADEFLPNGSVRAISLPDSLKNFATLGTIAGSVSSWNSLLKSMYVTGAPADMPLQFAIMAGFGAPIHSRGQDVGGIIHLFSAASAAGKTTVQRVIAAIYDAPKSPTNHPTMLIAAKTDTTKARTHKLGMLNSLALLNDEITEMSPQDIASFIYTSTQGRANDRMASDANRLRENNTNWGAYTITSSNKRLSDVYSRIMQDSEGMAKRVWEIEIPAVRIAGGLANDACVVEPLLSGAVYGVAGVQWIKWLVSNWARVVVEKTKIMERLVADAGLTRADRFFANMGASALVSAHFAGALGLHPFDSESLYAYTVQLLAGTTAATSSADKNLELIKLFITRNLNRVSRIDANGAFSLMLNAPLNGLVGVFNAVDNTLAISEHALSTAVVDAFGSPAELRRLLLEIGQIKTVKIAADPLVPITMCFVIDINSASARRLAIGQEDLELQTL